MFPYAVCAWRWRRRYGRTLKTGHIGGGKTGTVGCGKRLAHLELAVVKIVRDNDIVSYRERGDSTADLGDITDTLMPRNVGRLLRGKATVREQVGSADGRSSESHYGVSRGQKLQDRNILDCNVVYAS